jgi:hypothetical protein
MPKNTVTDPITDQEMAFAHLVLSGTMNDRQAAEAAGLNPDTAAYTKSKPRVRDYMIEHRNAVTEKLIDLEVEGLRKLNLGRDQVLIRLWELAKLSHEVTRGSIAGQIKALSMIIAIEGLIPGSRVSLSATQFAAQRFDPQIYNDQWRHKQQHQATGPQAADKDPGDAVIPPEAKPSAQQAPKPEPPPRPANDTPFPNLDLNHLSIANPFTYSEGLNRVAAATRYTLDTILDAAGPLRLPFSPKKVPFARGR